MASGAAAGGAAPGRVISQAGEVRSARVESLRAIAALGVVLGHTYGVAHGYGPVTMSSFWHRAVLGGGFGVYLFFVLSGYLLYWPFARGEFVTGARVSVRRYARNRALRILPLYCAVVAVLLVLTQHGGSFSQWWHFGLFAENYSNSTLLTVDGPIWSLVVEMQFYVLLPFVAYLAARFARGSLVRAALALGALALCSFVLRLQTFLTVSPRHVDPLLRYSLPSLFAYFAIGMLLALLRVAWERRPPAWLKGPLAGGDVWLLAAVPLWALVFWRYDWEILAGVAGALMLGACVLPLRRGRLLSALEWRWLALIGVASYSLYLWHVPIIDHLSGHVGGHRFASLAAVVIPVCVLAALISYAVIEAPFLRLRRRWVTAAREARDEAPSEPAAAPASVMVS